MDWPFIVLQQLVDNSVPVLPHAAALKIGLAVFWAVVLASAALFFSARLPRSWRWILAGLVAGWALWPGPASPTYWLGLAFQLPSWTTVLLCTCWLCRQAKVQKGAKTAYPPWAQSALLTLKFWAVAGVVIGWVLLADSFALFGASVYHWGFGRGAIAALLVVALIPWLLWGGRPHVQFESAAVMALLPAALALFVATRLPTGNVWDALLDPWLWLGLQVSWVWSFWQARRAGRRTQVAARVAVTPAPATIPD